MPDCLPSARLNSVTLRENIPVSVTIELTRRCPLSCLHCYLPETRGRAAAGRELAAAQWKKILRQLARAGGLYLVFTGGEPLLRPDLAEICAYAKKLNFDVRVFSSGLGLTAELARELKEAGLSAFEISLYGRPAVHDGITGLAGSFARSLAAARELRSAGIRVKIKAPLMNLNAGQANWLKALAKKEGFAVSFDLVIVPANDGDKTALKYRLGGRALAAAVCLTESLVPAVPADGRPSAQDLLCGAGRNVCALDPAGNLYPCLQLPVKLGNLTRRKFAAVWKNAWLKKWRRASVGDLQACLSCPDIEYCSRLSGDSLLEEGNSFAPNAPACALARALRHKSGS